MTDKPPPPHPDHLEFPQLPPHTLCGGPVAKYRAGNLARTLLYYLPGMGGRVNAGLGEALASRGGLAHRLPQAVGIATATHHTTTGAAHQGRSEPQQLGGTGHNS